MVVIGPEATPPESKAMPVYSPGTKKLMASDRAYPPMRNQSMGMRRTMRSMLSPTEIATPTDSPHAMAPCRMRPLDTSSTCFFSTATAGSAATVKKPMTAPAAMSAPGEWVASEEPSICPTGMKATLAPVRNMTSPTYVYTKPMEILST